MTIRGIGKKIEVVGFMLIIIFTILTILYTNFFSFTKNHILIVRMVGSIILLLGLIMHFYSAYIMYKGFKSKRLITYGPYSFCRNPMYSTIFFMIIPGLSFVVNSWLFMFAIPILLMVFVMYIKEEDAYLMNTFGKEYSEYKKKVKLLIPKVI